MSILPLIKGTVVVKLKDANEPVLAIFQLIKANEADSTGKGELGSTATLKGVLEKSYVSEDNKYTFNIFFQYDDNFGIPGAFYIRNILTIEFFLISLTLEDIPNVGNIHFDCNSWIYNEKKYQSDRIFFTNQTYLPSETPAPLVFYRQSELQTLRGDGTGERKKWERIYDYDFYNDLGNPDKDPSLARPVAGGSKEVPYPRRCRTGRPPTKTDPNSESPSELPYYIPRDELAVELVFEAVHQAVQRLHSRSTTEEDEFHTFDDVFELFETGQYPLPQVAQVNKSAWMTDEEFTRETIAGVNPNIIRNIEDVPPKVKLHYESEAFQKTRLFVLDYNETIKPHLRRINSLGSQVYASKTYLLLANDGTLKPLAIELTRPNPEGDESDFVTEVYFPAPIGTVEGSIWQLAKAYAVVNDECVHQIISHWLHTHAVTEPFVIAANRQLSVVHPIYKLLRPHFRNTMHINAAARKLLLNAGGAVEQIYAWGKIGVEMSSILYNDWVFQEQALPVDLIKRGMAVVDPTSRHGINLLIPDYPYAVDGLDIWGAIETWVHEYVYLYYKSDDLVQQDHELQAWWKEVVEVGHGDKKEGWPTMQTREDLIQSCVTIIWIGSALHASVNFSQYPYGALILNRPTLSRRFMPKEGTPEYKELVDNPQLAYLNTITSKPVTKVDLNMLELLSTHSSNEYYLGQRESSLQWTSDPRALEAFQKFGKTIAGIEDKINQRNADPTLKNRVGPVEMPYTLLYPTSEAGITFRGVPNSISI